MQQGMEQLILEELKKINGRLDNLETKMDGLETRVGSLEVKIDSLEARIDGLERELHEVKMYQENVLDKNIMLIRDGHIALERITKKLTERELNVEDKEIFGIRLTKAEHDILRLKTKVGIS